MTRLFEDPSLGFGNEGDLTAQPGPGVGLADTGGPDPLRAAVDTASQPQVSVPNIAPRPSSKDVFADMNGLQKFGLTLQEASAGMLGRPSPIDAYQKQRREDAALKVKELKEHVDALESGNKIARTLQGDAKKNFVADYSKQLNEMRPGLGDTFNHVAEQPDLLTQFDSYAQYLPESMKALLKANPDAFWKVAGSAEGLKMMEDAKRQKDVSVASKKATATASLLQQLPVPEELQKAFTDNPSAATFKKVQDALPEGHPAKLSEAQWSAINKDEHSQTLFYNSLNMASPREEADVRKKAAEDKGNVIEVGVAGGKMQKARQRADGTMELIGEPYTKKEGTTINFGAPVAGVDKDGNQVFFQPKKDGGEPSIVQGVKPPAKKENVLTTILQSAGGSAAAPKPNAAATGVKAKFAADPAMKDNTLGKETPQGFEVKDKSGKLIGYYK